MFHLERRTLLKGVAASLALTPMAGRAASDVLLTIEPPFADAPFTLTESDLLGLPQHEIRTETDFTDGLVAFRGPLAKDVLALAGVEEAAVVSLVAANDYSIDVPFEDFDRYGVVMAMEMDGARLTRRSRGPIWLMYPVDQVPLIERESVNDKLIWQLTHIRIK